MDFITDLPPVKGHDSILMVVNQGLTKGIILIPCSKVITTEETAQLLLENLYKHFGLPDKSYLIEDPNLHQVPLSNFWSYWELNCPYLPPINPRQMEPLNE